MPLLSGYCSTAVFYNLRQNRFWHVVALSRLFIFLFLSSFFAILTHAAHWLSDGKHTNGVVIKCDSLIPTVVGYVVVHRGKLLWFLSRHSTASAFGWGLRCRATQPCHIDTWYTYHTNVCTNPESDEKILSSSFDPRHTKTAVSECSHWWPKRQLVRENTHTKSKQRLTTAVSIPAHSKTF